MQAKEATVRLQALDGVWEVGGRDRKRGIMPENVSLVSDLWGPLTASFDLRRDGRATWPDLGAFTPVEVEIGGKVVWAGRIQQTPTSLSASDRVISVQAQGWQVHLDDDLYEQIYVHTRVSDWRDMRTFPNARLGAATLPAAGQVSSDNGAIQLALPKDTVTLSGAMVGVMLDLGPSSGAAGISFDYETSNNAGTGWNVYCQSFTSDDATTSATNATTPEALTSLGAFGSRRGAFGTSGQRYVAIFLTAGSSTTITADIWVKLKGIRLFGSDAYRSTDASILKASDVIADSLAQATVLLDTDRTGIAPTSFAIPDFAMSSPQTPREVWSAVNAYHDYISQIDVQKRPVFKAKPTAPMYEVGSWSPLELEDQSANSGDEIYNRVIVTGSQPDGSPLRVVRATTQASPTSASELFVVPNSYFNTSDTGMTFAVPAGGTVQNYHNVSGSPGAFETNTPPPYEGAKSLLMYALAPGAIPAGAITGSETLTGTFKAGRTYLLQYAAYSENARVDPTNPDFYTYATVSFGTASVKQTFTGGWAVYSLAWVPRVTTTNPTISFASAGGGGIGLDSIRVFQVTATVIDRRGFTRTKELPVSGALTEVAAQKIGDLWLSAHKTTPYKGSFKLTGDRSVRDPANGTPVKLETLLLHTGELIRDMAAIDPDTGGIGRDGRIAQVTYTPATEEATVTLDNSRASFEALLARLDLLNGTGK